MRSPSQARQLNTEVVDFDLAKGILVERTPTDGEHLDGYVHRCESYDPETNRIEEWLSLAEAEHLELIDERKVAELRELIVAARAMRGAA